MDFVASNMGDPASLVINETQGAGAFIGVRLSARHSARDAIGSVVEVRAGKRTWKKQLTAGDGYMASNERWLQFGIGKSAYVDQITVVWPSGSQSMAEKVPSGATIEFIESSPQAVQRTTPVTSSLIAVTVSPIP